MEITVNIDARGFGSCGIRGERTARFEGSAGVLAPPTRFNGRSDWPVAESAIAVLSRSSAGGLLSGWSGVPVAEDI